MESNIAIPSNKEMSVSGESEGVAGKESMAIGVKELAKFAVEVELLYEKLSGGARIEEPDGVHMYISFMGNGRGRITVKGYLSKRNRAGNQQDFYFENVIDQTVLKQFADDLVKSYGKYTQE